LQKIKNNNKTNHNNTNEMTDGYYVVGFDRLLHLSCFINNSVLK